MRIDLLELGPLQRPPVRAFETSVGRVAARTVVLVTVHADGAEGSGGSVADDEPPGADETAATAGQAIDVSLVPRLLAAPPAHAPHVGARTRLGRRHHMTKAADDMASVDRFSGPPLVLARPGIGVTIVPGRVDRAPENRLTTRADAA